MIDGQPLACFQPFIDTATGRIAGVEALGRLRQADGQLTSVGPLFADSRIPAVALRRLDRQIRDHALSRLHAAPKDWFLSLNVSPRWVNRLRPDQDLPSLKQMTRHGVDPQRIVYEITEVGGDMQRLDVLNPPLGLLPGAEFGEQSLAVAPGSRLRVFNKGAFDFMDRGGRRWALDDFEAMLAFLPATASVPEQVFTEVRRVAERQVPEDDFLLLQADFAG